MSESSCAQDVFKIGSVTPAGHDKFYSPGREIGQGALAGDKKDRHIEYISIRTAQQRESRRDEYDIH